MKFLKSHISLIIALVSILFSIEVYTVFNKILKTYEEKIIDEYSIIVVSDKKFSKLQNKNIVSVEEIDISKSVKNMESTALGIDSNTIIDKLPHFYKLKLSKLLNPSELEKLEKDLKSFSFIKRVESFKSNQHKVYNLLLMLDSVTKIFMLIILFIAFLLILKQMEVWKLEHSESMYIMELFGAPFWLRSVKLLKLAIIDSLVSVVLIYIIIFYVTNSYPYLEMMKQLGIDITINIFSDSIKMLLIAFVISLLSTIIVIKSKRRNS
jgi:cell division transport system permease protein